MPVPTASVRRMQPHGAASDSTAEVVLLREGWTDDARAQREAGTEDAVS
ncbi:hypothetical protein ACI3KS_12880 [Microbacterium sp. ZW T5_45]